MSGCFSKPLSTFFPFFFFWCFSLSFFFFFNETSNIADFLTGEKFLSDCVVFGVENSVELFLRKIKREENTFRIRRFKRFCKRLVDFYTTRKTEIEKREENLFEGILDKKKGGKLLALCRGTSIPIKYD